MNHFQDIANGNNQQNPESDVSCEPPDTSLQTMFVELVMRRRIENGQRPVLRPVFLKLHGILLGHFQVADCEFTRAGVILGDYDSYLKYHSLTA